MIIEKYSNEVRGGSHAAKSGFMLRLVSTCIYMYLHVSTCLNSKLPLHLVMSEHV